MHEMRTRDGIPGEAERPATAHMREVRFEEYREGIFDVCGQVRNFIVQLKLPDGHVPALMI